jgi:hypothetical protein
MAKKPLDEKIYHQELDRLESLHKFPQLPAFRQEMIRAMRRITECDKEFLHRLVTYFVDHADVCPTPHELIQAAGELRSRHEKSLGNPSCMKCGGTGWVRSVRTVRVPGMTPYDADCAERCGCAPPAAKPDAA